MSATEVEKEIGKVYHVVAAPSPSRTHALGMQLTTKFWCFKSSL